MSNRSYIMFVFACLSVASDVRAETAPCQGRIEGRVVERFEDVDDVFGLFEAKVELHQGPGSIRQAMTGLEGEFVFEKVCSNHAELIVRLEGYETTRVESPVGQWVEVVMPLAENGTTEPWQTVTTRTNKELRDARTRVTLGKDEIEDERGVPLAKMLEKLPGVRALETGNVSKPMIQGMHSNRVVIVFDGLRHESLSWGLDHAPEIDPFTAERISVVKGAAGVRYGPDAIGGVVLVEPHPLPHKDLSLHGDMHLVGLSNGRQLVGATTLYGGLPGVDGFGWRLQGSGKFAGSLETPDYVLDNTGARELNASFAVGMKRPTWGLEFAASRFHALNGIFTGAVSENLSQFQDAIARQTPRGVERYRFDYDLERPRQEVTHTIFKLHGHRDVYEGGRLEATVSLQRNERSEFDLVRQSIVGPQLDFALSTGAADVSWLAQFGERWSWSLGVLGGLQENVYRGRRFIPNYRSLSGGTYTWVKRQAERVDVELGARVDVEHMTTFQREAVGGADAGVDSFELSYLTPSLVAGARWRVVDALDLSLNLSTASRAPSIDELFVDGVSQGVASFLTGDRELSPEQTWAATGNLEFAADWLDARISPYVQYIDGYIYAAPKLDTAGDPVVRLTINGGFPSLAYRQVDALFAGVDADVRVTPYTWLELQTSASMVRARDLIRDDYLVFIPPDTISQAVSFKAERLGPLKKASLGGQVAYTAEQTRVDPNADFTSPPSAYLLAHAHVSATFPLREDALRVSLEVKNITDQRYRNYLSRFRYFADEPGRSVNIRMKYDF